ncbi:MAG: IS1 family transposase [Ekhidna sp.]|nr:IS1 family transposase [Ekhidna sp.]
MDRAGKRVLGFTIGDRSEKTGDRLCSSLIRMQIRLFYTDHWKAYESILPADKHVQSKAETYSIEGLNSMISHYLARFRRKTKCYSKAQERIVYSLNLLFNHIAIPF